MKILSERRLQINLLFCYYISEVYDYLSCETQGDGNNEDSSDDKKQKLLEQCRNILNIFEMTYDFSSEVEDSSYLDMSANCNIISMNHLFLLLLL